MADRLPTALIPSSLPSPVQALLVLQRHLVDGTPTEPHTLEAIARWRLACGDGPGAARWRRWSLQPPLHQSLIEALTPLLYQNEQPEAAQELALAQGEGLRAERLQQRALAAALPLASKQRMELLQAWRDRHQPQRAIELLQSMPDVLQSAPLCHLAGQLLEQIGQPAAAARWWDRSLALEPHQTEVLAHRTRNALTLGDQRLAKHLAHTLQQLGAQA